jgi:hypothetical protein
MPSNTTDPSLRSFLFTLKNPNDVLERRFAGKAEQKTNAICCHDGCGPYFYGIRVRNNCNANTNRSTYYFGCSCINNTGLNGSTFFTGSEYFQVLEIEVFEITD